LFKAQAKRSTNSKAAAWVFAVSTTKMALSPKGNNCMAADCATPPAKLKTGD
jgi:hypothetical protein